jgi:hypothetical protein
MQTFLPYADFGASVQILDYRRLGKQRVEAKHLLDILTGLKADSRYRNHPAVKMWRGYENALTVYYNECVREWVRRGFNNNMPLLPEITNPKMPPFVGNEAFHLSHMSNLIRKNPDFYRQKFPAGTPDDKPYIW